MELSAMHETGHVVRDSFTKGVGNVLIVFNLQVKMPIFGSVPHLRDYLLFCCFFLFVFVFV